MEISLSRSSNSIQSPCVPRFSLLQWKSLHVFHYFLLYTALYITPFAAGIVSSSTSTFPLSPPQVNPYTPLPYPFPCGYSELRMVTVMVSLSRNHIMYLCCPVWSRFENAVPLTFSSLLPALRCLRHLLLSGSLNLRRAAIGHCLFLPKCAYPLHHKLSHTRSSAW